MKKTLLTTTTALGFLFSLSSILPAKAWDYEPACERDVAYDCEPVWYYNAAAFRRYVPHDYCGYREYRGYKDLAWRYPRYFLPVCEPVCSFDFLGNPYKCHTVCY